jgi:hypothetical protein
MLCSYPSVPELQVSIRCYIACGRSVYHWGYLHSLISDCQLYHSLGSRDGRCKYGPVNYDHGSIPVSPLEVILIIRLLMDRAHCHCLRRRRVDQLYDYAYHMLTRGRLGRGSRSLHGYPVRPHPLVTHTCWDSPQRRSTHPAHDLKPSLDGQGRPAL